MSFGRLEHWFRSRRAAKLQAREAVLHRIQEAVGERPGPPAVALARLRFLLNQEVAIDPLETEWRARPGGYEVRAWVLVPHAEVPVRLAGSLASTMERLGPQPSIVRRVFFLNAAYGIPLGDVALLLGMHLRDVRRAMLAAIASLDVRGG